MREAEQLKTFPPDNLTVASDGKFEGAGYVYKTTGSGIEVAKVSFDIKPRSPLDPFRYKKPAPYSNNPFERPQKFTLDQKPRTGYFPIGLATNALRPRGHLYERDHAIFAATNSGTPQEPKWETRYFPQKSLEPETWNQAIGILRGELPDALLKSKQVAESGLARDYINTFTGATTLAEALARPAERPEMTELARDTFLDTLREIKTYSEYWKGDIEAYNATAEEEEVEPVDPGKAFDLLVTAQSGAQDLDEIAQRVRDLAESESPESAVKPFIKLTIEAIGMVMGKSMKGFLKHLQTLYEEKSESPDAS